MHLQFMPYELKCHKGMLHLLYVQQALMVLLQSPTLRIETKCEVVNKFKP